MPRIILAIAALLTLGTAPAASGDNDGTIRIAILLNVHIALIEACGYAKGTAYEEEMQDLVEVIRPHLSDEDFAGAREAALMMDLTCSEENYHVRRLLRAAEQFNAKPAPR